MAECNETDVSILSTILLHMDTEGNTSVVERSETDASILLSILLHSL